MPESPNPAGLQPFGKLLGLGHVALHVARCLFPLPDSFSAGTGAEVPLGELPSNLIPGSRYEAAQLIYRSKRRPHEQEQVEVPRPPLLYAKPLESGEGLELPLKALPEGLEVSFAVLRILWVFVGVGQG